ncbi:MAG: hypothetical protein Q8L81_16305 [Bacteroidota bacterium]|nr:hypothetical protein [Bacteroidota bacterium]
MFKKAIFCFFLLLNVFAWSQKNDSNYTKLRLAEKEIIKIEKGFNSRKEADRIEANKKLISAWDAIIDDPKILTYPFDSIKGISILSPKDKKFKLITWNLNKDDGTHTFFGYLVVNNSKRIKKGFFKHETVEAFEHFKLSDRSATIKNPETYIGTTDKWLGMLYTSLIECDGFYTLIAWDGNDKLIQRKFIDVLYFKADGTPVFGKDVFKFPRKNPRRLMFEYSSEVTMSVKYNEKRNQITYSHLAPKQEGSLLEGQFQYYGPDGSFDALELRKDKWITIEDIDARNDKNKNDKAEKPDPNKQTPIFTPK